MKKVQRDRDKAVLEQGFGRVAPGACWDSGGRNSAARPFGKEEVWTVSRCQSETETLAHALASQLLVRRGVRFRSGQPGQGLGLLHV